MLLLYVIDLDTCDEHSVCTNTLGAHECECWEGFSGDGRTCVDIDECQSGHFCHSDASCSNTPGLHFMSVVTEKDDYQPVGNFLNV